MSYLLALFILNLASHHSLSHMKTLLERKHILGDFLIGVSGKVLQGGNQTILRSFYDDCIHSDPNYLYQV